MSAHSPARKWQEIREEMDTLPLLTVASVDLRPGDIFESDGYIVVDTQPVEGDPHHVHIRYHADQCPGLHGDQIPSSYVSRATEPQMIRRRNA